MKLPRPLLFLAASAAVLLIVFIFGALLVPRLLDSRAIREKIGAELAKRFAGRVTVGRVTIPGFPRPRVVMENVEASFAETTTVSIKTLELFPSLLHLLRGRVLLRRVRVEKPAISIRLPESSTEPFGREAWEKWLRAVLQRVTRESPAPRLDVTDGSAEVTIGNRKPVIVERVKAYGFASDAELRFEFSARSTLCEYITIQADIGSESLASRVDIEVRRLKLREFLPLVPLPIPASVQDGEATLRSKIAAIGLRQVNASIDGAAGPIVFARHRRSASMEAQRLKAELRYADGDLLVDLVQLQLGAPRLQASGELNIKSGSSSARVRLRGVDLAKAGGLASLIVDDPETVSKMLRYVPAGAIPEMTIQVAGRSFAEMASTKNLLVSASLQDGKIIVPGADLELQNVTGSVRISPGIIEADRVSVNLGATKGWNGKLRLGLGAEAAAFHLDLSVRGAAADIHSVLLKVVHDQAFRGELLKVTNVEGELAGRLIVGERLGAIVPIVTISQTQIAASYAPLPFPIALRGGRFRYDETGITIENGEGAIGHSAFRGLGLTLRHDGRRRFELAARQISLDLQQMRRCLASFAALRSRFEKLPSAEGRIELDHLSATGAFDEPSQWRFAATGRFDGVGISHGDLPGPLILSRGQFAAEPGRINFSDSAVSLSDGAGIIGGTFAYEKERPLEFEASGTASIGAQIIEWLGRRVELPHGFKPRAPLNVVADRVAWRAGAVVSFDGQVIVAGGPRLSLRALKDLHGLSLQDLSVVDGSSRARIDFEWARDRLAFSFKGELAQQTIDGVFAAFPARDTALRGDIRVNVSLERPVRVSARGRLDGSNLWLPFGNERALLEKFRIDADGEIILIRSADLRWRNTRLAVSGKAVAAERLWVDADVTADQISWKDLQHVSNRASVAAEQRSEPSALPSLEGTIRLKTARLGLAGFTLSPFEGTAAISTGGVAAHIDHAIACGITVTGRVDFLGREIGVDLRLAATGAQLESTAVCLTNRQNDVTGTFSLRARVLGRGERQELLKTLRGDLEFTAHDGEFIRAPGIDAAFDYLNATGDFKVAFPDLGRQTFPYRLITVKGKMRGEVLAGDEIIVQSALVNLSGHANLNLAQKTIEAKGLIAVLKPVDEVVGRIPVIGPVWGGSLVGIPVRVSGPLGRPEVGYLAPADVGAELLDVPVRILGIPIGAMRLFAPEEKLD
jgi:hypothetical protein